MGRLPSHFAQRLVTYRQPWGMYGEIILTSGQTGIPYPEATFLNATDKPFEIHRMIPRITALDNAGVPLVTTPSEFDQLLNLVKISITDLGKNTPLQKSATRLRNLVKGSSELTWEWADPYYLIRTEQFNVVLDADPFPAIAGLVSLRVELAFQGFFVVIAPPSENR